MYSERIMALVRENVDVMEQTGIDEAFFDVTARSGGSFEAAAMRPPSSNLRYFSVNA